MRRYRKLYRPQNLVCPHCEHVFYNSSGRTQHINSAHYISNWRPLASNVNERLNSDGEHGEQHDAEDLRADDDERSENEGMGDIGEHGEQHDVDDNERRDDLQKAFKKYHETMNGKFFVCNM